MTKIPRLGVALCALLALTACDPHSKAVTNQSKAQASDLQSITMQPAAAVQLQAPQQTEDRFADAVQGCSLLSKNARTVGCYREELDMGFVEDFLELFPVGSTEPKVTLHLYSGHMGEEFDPATIDGDGIAMANALLQQGGYENIGVVLDGDAMEPGR